MKIILHNLSNNDHSKLTKRVDELKNVIRVSYRANIYIIDSIDNIFEWATLTSMDLFNEKRTVIIASPEIIDVLNNMLISDYYLYVNINNSPENIVIEIAKFLSCNIARDNHSKRESIVLSETEAETMYDFYTRGKAFSKKRQNIKYRIMKKIDVKNSFQFFIWWNLMELLPTGTLKKRVCIK